MAQRSDTSGLSRLSPSPFARPRAAEPDEFTDVEATTRPGGPNYQFERLAAAWRALSQEDRNWLDRVVEVMAWSKKT